MEKAYIKALDKAVMAVTSGATDFHSAMRDTIRELGGSGIRVHYGGDVTRSLESAVRQSLLWGAKQASTEYDDALGEELGCDGIEVDWHSNPRPEHEFMQGQQYVLGKARTINGVRFESADEALERLNDYGCLHYKTSIICGVSEPRYSPEELKRLNAQNAKTYDINGKKVTGYQAQQMMRRLESATRTQKTEKALAKASGDNAEVKKCNEKIKAFRAKYDELTRVTGFTPDYKRMGITRTPKTTENPLTNSGNGGIINTKILNNKIVNPMNEQKYYVMKSNLEKNGIKVVHAKGDDLKYLNSLGAEASYGNGYILHIGETPSASAFFEEIIHSTQAKKYGEFDSTDFIELCAREIAANRKLLKHSSAYKFEKSDISDIEHNLKYWEKAFKERMGKSYDESSYRREV